MALPPFDAGTVQVSATWALAAVPATVVGASATVIGVTADDEDENEPAPAAFTAATLNRYAVPLVSPVTVMDVVLEAVCENVVQLTPLSEEYCTV